MRIMLYLDCHRGAGELRRHQVRWHHVTSGDIQTNVDCHRCIHDIHISMSNSGWLIYFSKPHIPAHTFVSYQFTINSIIASVYSSQPCRTWLCLALDPYSLVSWSMTSLFFILSRVAAGTPRHLQGRHLRQNATECDRMPASQSSQATHKWRATVATGRDPCHSGTSLSLRKYRRYEFNSAIHRSKLKKFDTGFSRCSSSRLSPEVLLSIRTPSNTFQDLSCFGSMDSMSRRAFNDSQIVNKEIVGNNE